MTTYVWNSAVSGNASVNTNWTPTGVPGAGDICQFNATGVGDCTFDLSAVGEIQVLAGFIGALVLNQNCTLQGLKIDNEVPSITSTSATVLTFNGTPAYNSGATYIVMANANPIQTSAARANLTYKFSGSAQIKYDPGIYPHIILDTGSHTPDYIAPSVTDATDVKLLSLTVNSGATFAPASATPNSNDRLKNWIFEDTGNYFVTNNSAFNGGYATWTFQAKTSGFTLPTDGGTGYNGCDFTFRKMIIDASIDGAGAYAKVTGATTLVLNNLTINVGASVKGDDTLGAAIHLVNKPDIKGTWGFHPIADGIYHYKSNHTIGVANGGTGLQALASTRVPFGDTYNQMNSDANFTFANDSVHVDKGIKITENADHPVTPSAGEGVIWVKNETPNKLYFTDDAGTDHDLLAGGGGGGSGTVTSIATTAPITGGTITNTGTIGISAATTSAAGSMSSADKTKLDGIESNAEVNVGLEYARWYGKNTGSDLYTVSSGGRQYLDLADTSKFGESSTGTHSSITLVNASTDYITLTKGGIYQIVISLESFPSSTVATHDRWIEVNTNSSANRALGTARMQTTGSSNGNWNAQKTVVHEIPSSGSDVDVYISFLTNGTGASIRAYDDNRISVAITRLGDASV